LKKSRILVDFSGKNEAANHPPARFLHAPGIADGRPVAVNLFARRWSIGYHNFSGAIMKPFDRIANPRDIRRKLRLNQLEFWSRIGVTQSGGSRYESGRSMPKPVRELLRLVHIEGIELGHARGRDFEVVAYLRHANPRLYRRLSKAARGKNGHSKR
jgi:hypothetical protein